MVWIALFRARSPPRLSRCRVAPAAGFDRAGPAERGERRLAAAPPRMRERHDHLGGADRPDAVVISQPRGEVVDDGLQLGPVVLELAALVAQGDRPNPDLRLAHRLGPGRLWGGAAGSQSVEGDVGELAAGQ